MKNLNVILIFTVWIGGMSRNLGGVESSCNSRQLFTAAEFYLSEENGEQVLAGDTNAVNFFRLCEPVSPPDTVGFGNLYSVNGSIIQSCDDGICVTASKFSNPYCQLVYEVGGPNLSPFGIWQIAFLEEDTTRLFPSCNEILLQFNMTPNADSTVYLTEGIFGANSFFNTFQPVDGNGLLASETRRTFLNNSPYAQIVEDKLRQFFITEDTIRFQISSNEMTFELGDQKIRFFRQI